MANIPITNLPPTTAAQANNQIPAVQNGTTVYLTVDQIAQYTQSVYPSGYITSITAQSPLSGGTITTSGTIGLTTGSLTNAYLSNMNAYTIKGNNTAGSATPVDLTVAQTMSLLGAAPLNSPAFTGTPTAPTPSLSDSSTALATTAFVKSQGYGAGITSITAGTGLSGGTITTTGTIAIANTGVSAQSYGSASVVPVITVNAQGQLTAATTANISITPSQVSGLGTMATQNANSVAITGGSIDQTTVGATTPSSGKFTTLTATGNSNFATITSGTWNGTLISVNYGGTGSNSASGARTNLGAAASGANSDITSLSGLTTPLSETQGGTGYSSYTTGDILYASSSTTLARLSDVAAGNALISGGVGIAPSWGKIGLTSHVSGTLPVANGGTGAITLTGYLVGNGTGAFTAVSTIPNAGLTNSAITIGSTSISLGASSSTLSGLTTVTVTQDPTSALQLSTKQYVDNTVSTVANTTYHTAAGYATTADLGTVTYNNGTGGVGATLTNAGTQAALTIDGYTFTGTDVSNATRVLVKNETSAAYNGIYVVTNQGSGSTNWVLTRSTDFNATGSGPNFIETGAAAYVSNGSTNGATSWTMTTTGTITVGSTALTWSQISSSGNIQVSAPITKTGNTIGLGTVGVANGGTGLTTLTAYGLLYAASTSSVGQISPSTTGYALLSTGASSAPAFGQVSLTAGVTGTLPVANGGTGTATAFTTGSMVFAGASGIYTQNNSKLFWDNTNFRLGLNTASPNSTLTIVSNIQSTTPPSNASLPAGTDLYIMGANAANTRITQDAYGTGSYGVYTARSARGTAAVPTASQSGDTLSQFTGRGYGATGFATVSNGYFSISAAENFTDTAQGAYASVFTSATGNNSPTEAFRFGPAGQLGIGGATYGTSGQFFLSGGASAAPTWTTVTLATLGGVVPVASGGTNLTSYTTGDILYASGSTTIAKLSDVATGAVLVSGGVGVAPSYSTTPTVTSITTGSISNSGNATFTGTSSRILGDFSNTTIINRLAFQTSTTNGTTGIYALPNGTATAASWQATNTADPTNTSKILIATNGSTDVQLVSGINGTGTYLPLSFFTNGSGQFAINTSGAWGIGSVAASTVNYGTSGQAFISGGSAAQPTWGTLGIAGGGTGLTSTPANGALDIGNGTGFTRTTLTQGTGMTITNASGSITIANAGVTSLTGTASQVTVSASTGGVTLSLPSTINVNTSGSAASLSATLAVGSGGTGATTLTGILKGNGTSAFTAATAGTDYVAPATATTFTATQTFNGSSSVLAAVLTNAAETTTVSATAATGTINFYTSSQSVLYYTTSASANWTLNVAHSAGTSLNTALSTGQTITIAFMVTNGATAYYQSAFTIDGTAVTPKWQGGTAPSAGDASAVDIYTYTIVKTGSATYTVFASVTKFA